MGIVSVSIASDLVLRASTALEVIDHEVFGLERLPSSMYIYWEISLLVKSGHLMLYS